MTPITWPTVRSDAASSPAAISLVNRGNAAVEIAIANTPSGIISNSQGVVEGGDGAGNRRGERQHHDEVHLGGSQREGPGRHQLE